MKIHSKMPRTPHRPVQQAVGLGVVGKTFLFRVPSQFSPELYRYHSEMTYHDRTMSHLDRRYRLSAAANAVNKVLLVVVALVKMNFVRPDLGFQQLLRTRVELAPADEYPNLTPRVNAPATFSVKPSAYLQSNQ